MRARSVRGGGVPAEKEELIRQAMDNFEDGVCFVDQERRITYWSAGAERITGYAAEEVLGRSCAASVLLHVDAAGDPLCLRSCPMASTIEDGETREEELFLRHKLGHRLPVWVRDSPIRNWEGEIVGAVEVFNSRSVEVSALGRREHLEEEGLLDPVTRLGNRRYGEITLGDRVAELQRYGWPFGAFLLEVDGFEPLLRTHGREVGDEVLRMVGRTLLSSTRATDFLGRWEGGRFLAVMVNVDSDRLTQIAERFRILVARSSLGTGGTALAVTASIGAALALPEDTAETFLARICTLASRARREGGDRVLSG